MIPRVVNTLAAAGLTFFVSMPVEAAVSYSEGVWNGDIRNGKKCIFIENESLRITILKEGAYIISVVDKATKEDFINCTKANRSDKHGIYDRIDIDGKHLSDVRNPKHFVNQEYKCERIDDDTFLFSCPSEATRVERRVKLHSILPKMRIDVKYTRLSPEVAQLRMLLITQFNLNKADVSYNQVVVMPGEEGVDRFVVENRGHYGESPKYGWWFATDRHSKKSVVMTYPTDGQAESIYLYRTPNWIHLLPFGPVKLAKANDTVSLWQEYHFLSGKSGAESLKSKDVSVVGTEFGRLKKALLEELSTPPVLPGQERAVVLPELAEGNRIEMPVGGRPQASVCVVRSAIYDHPEKLDAQSWVSLDSVMQSVAETKGKVDFVITSGASANGLAKEFELAREAFEKTGASVTYAASRIDAKNIAGFEKALGPRNWVRKVNDVTFIGFAPGEDEWLESSIKSAAGSRVVVVGDSIPSELAAKTNVNLALLPLGASMPSFQRIGNWPVVSFPSIQRYPAYTVVHVFPDYLDVALKPLGSSFGPHIYLDRSGKSRALGLPLEIKDKPILKVAHITDTQLHIPSRYKAPNGKPLDQENMKQAVAEINDLGVDFAVNTGDLINVGVSEDQWKLYLELKEPLKVQLYEVLGNHDWDQMTPTGQAITTNYKLYCDDPLIYDFEKNGILFVAFGTAVAKGDDLRQRMSKAAKAKCTVLLYHDPISKGGGYGWWNPDLYDAAYELKPTIAMLGHTHYLQWHEKQQLREFVGPGLAWTKTGDQSWNGFFIHSFFEDKVVSSFKRLGCDDIFFTVVTPYRK